PRRLVVRRRARRRVEVGLALLDEGVDLPVAVELVVLTAEVPSVVLALVDGVEARWIGAAEPRELRDVEVVIRQRLPEEVRVRRQERDIGPDADGGELLREDRGRGGPALVPRSRREPDGGRGAVACPEARVVA